MSARSSWSRRLRKRVNRRLYGALFRAYRALFPTPAWTGQIPRASLRRLLIIQHYGVGDLILTTPLIAFLKDQAPQAEIDVLASPRNAPVLAGDERVSRVFVHDHSWRRWLAVLPKLRARRYDATFSGQSAKGLDEGLTASLAAHRRTYKISVWRPKRYQGLFTTLTRVRPAGMHTAEHVLNLGYHALGMTMPPAGRALRAYPMRAPDDAAAGARVTAFVADRQLEPFIIVNLTAFYASRDWAPEHCARFVLLLLERHADLAVVVTPAPRKPEAAGEVVRRCASPRVTLAPMFALLELASLVRHAAVVVSTNTALVHLASACRRPVVAVYAPELPADATLWLPVGVPYRALASPMRGVVSDIAPEAIADAFDELRREAASRADTPLVSAARRAGGAPR
ncbi:MAG: glycosyltransferase family 9 protein [Gemmatimonadaceae bacterium]